MHELQISQSGEKRCEIRESGTLSTGSPSVSQQAKARPGLTIIAVKDGGLHKSKSEAGTDGF